MSNLVNLSTYITGAILDPRFKKDWIPFSGQNEGDVIACVRAELEFRYRKLREDGVFNHDGEGTNPGGVVNGTTDQDGPTATKRSRPERQLYSTLIKPARPASAGGVKVLDEFDQYLKEPTSPMEITEESGDPKPLRPLKFWLDNRPRFPSLSLIARDVLGIPASSGSIEKCFSTAVDILGIKRGNMKNDLFNQLLFIKRNRKLLDD